MVVVTKAEEIAAVNVIGRVVLRLVEQRAERSEKIGVEFHDARVPWDEVNEAMALGARLSRRRQREMGFHDCGKVSISCLVLASQD